MQQTTGKNQNQRGAGMAEYTLLLTLIAVVLVAGFQGLAAAIAGAVANAASQF